MEKALDIFQNGLFFLLCQKHDDFFFDLHLENLVRLLEVKSKEV